MSERRYELFQEGDDILLVEVIDVFTDRNKASLALWDTRRLSSRARRLRGPAARAKWILAQRNAGRSLQDIGDELGLTRERVRQIEQQQREGHLTPVGLRGGGCDG